MFSWLMTNPSWGRPCACCWFTTDMKHFDLVITDFTMPGMKGDALAVQIKARRPGLPVIMLTAYAESIRASKNPLPGVDALINKPFDLADFRGAVAQALAGRNLPPAS